MSKWPASSQDKALLAVTLLLILFALNTWVAGNEAGARIYRTDPCGTLTAISDGQAVQVECYYVSLPLVMQAAGDSAPMLTPTPPVMCTPPPCRTGEVYYCPGACPGGCGTQCATVTSTPTPTPTETRTPTPTLTDTRTPTPTPTPSVMCTPPPCRTGEVYYCPGTCPGGCGTQCATVTPSPCMAAGC
jgi:hypothetical protein